MPPTATGLGVECAREVEVGGIWEGIRVTCPYASNWSGPRWGLAGTKRDTYGQLRRREPRAVGDGAA